MFWVQPRRGIPPLPKSILQTAPDRCRNSHDSPETGKSQSGNQKRLSCTVVVTGEKGHSGAAGRHLQAGFNPGLCPVLSMIPQVSILPGRSGIPTAVSRFNTIQ
ncbi:MAG TPA: hypothetical protein DIT89_00565 [Planctomycetaceae bacterium]|nr:hypothetical protein [Planctomycetaceae bacterium]